MVLKEQFFIPLINWVNSKRTIFGRTTPPHPPFNFVHGSHMQYMDIIGHVAQAASPLACPSHSARSRKRPYLT